MNGDSNGYIYILHYVYIIYYVYKMECDNPQQGFNLELSSIYFMGIQWNIMGI